MSHENFNQRRYFDHLKIRNSDGILFSPEKPPNKKREFPHLPDVVLPLACIILFIVCIVAGCWFDAENPSRVQNPTQTVTVKNDRFRRFESEQEKELLPIWETDPDGYYQRQRIKPK